MRRTTGLLLLFVLCATLVYAAQPVSKPHESYAPYWTSEPGWITELQLKNNLPSAPLTVTPVLRLASGREIVFDSTTIPPNTSVSVWVNKGLLDHAPDLFGQPGSYGSVVFRYTSPGAGNLYASVLLSIHGEPISFPMLARSAEIATTAAGSSLEGIWWQPASAANDVLVIGNHSDTNVSGTLVLYDASGKRWQQTLVLGPQESKRMATSDLVKKAGFTGSYGGISFVTENRISAVDAAHFVYDEVSRFSASEALTRRDPNTTLSRRAGPDAKHWTMYAPMLALTKPDPALGLPRGTVLQPTLLIRNTTAKNINADLSLTWLGDSATDHVKLPRLNLAPFATQQMQIGTMQPLLRIPDNAHWGLVTLTTDALPDDLVADATSVDSSVRYSLPTRFAGGIGGHFTGGEWRIDADHNELAAVTNIGSKATKALLALHYDNGQKTYELQQTISPGDQMWVNLAQLIRQRVSDRKGNTLPVDLNSVTYDLQDLTPGGHSLMVDAVALDSSLGFQDVPLHLSCCGYDSASWDPNAFDLVIDGTEFGSIQGINQCTGQPTDISSEFTSWWSGNSAVATVTTKQVHGVGAGSTDGYASGYVTVGNASYCTVVPEQVYAPITVVALPVNFRQTAAQDAGSGNLKFTYEWDSDTGNINDLSHCSVREYVTYPGSGNFNWTSPPYDTSGNPTSNPTVSNPPFAGTDGGVIDNNLHPGFLKPYVYNQFAATQKFQYSCTNYQSGAWQDFSFGSVSIVRTVQNSPPWTYSITKSGSTASVNLP